MRDCEIVRPILGSVVYHARLDIGSIVVFRLTFQPDMHTEDCYLRICLCDWSLRDAAGEWAHSESPAETIDAAVAGLLKRELQEIRFWHRIAKEESFCGATLRFQGDIRMTLTPYVGAAKDDEIFVARETSGHWMSYLSDGSLETKEMDPIKNEANEMSADASQSATIVNALIRCTRGDRAAHPVFELARADAGLWVLELEYGTSESWETQIDSICSQIESHGRLLSNLKDGSADFTLHFSVETDERSPLRIPSRLSRFASHCGFEIEISLEPRRTKGKKSEFLSRPALR